MIQFRKATLDDLDLLVNLRIHDLKMYSQQTISDMTIQNIRLFYQEKLEKDECMTLLGYDQEYLIATSSLYQYRVMPSNENPSGKVGQITNV